MQVEFPKIHDLVRLLDIAAAYLPALQNYRTAFAEMSDYAVGVRYPEEIFEPARGDVLRYLALAEEVVQRVKRIIL
jgi:HEPN domain-containing protein